MPVLLLLAAAASPWHASVSFGLGTAHDFVGARAEAGWNRWAASFAWGVANVRYASTGALAGRYYFGDSRGPFLQLSFAWSDSPGPHPQWLAPRAPSGGSAYVGAAAIGYRTPGVVFLEGSIGLPVCYAPEPYDFESHAQPGQYWIHPLCDYRSPFPDVGLAIGAGF